MFLSAIFLTFWEAVIVLLGRDQFRKLREFPVELHFIFS